MANVRMSAKGQKLMRHVSRRVRSSAKSRHFAKQRFIRVYGDE